MTDHPLESGHPLTDEKCNKLSIFDLDECSAPYAYGIMADMRAAYDKGYADALEDAQDIITCIQRKDSPSTPITLEELKDL